MSDRMPKFDVRVVDFHLRHRNVKEDEYASYLKDLPDDAEECEETETRFSNPYERRNYDEQPEEG